MRFPTAQMSTLVTLLSRPGAGGPGVLSWIILTTSKMLVSPPVSCSFLDAFEYSRSTCPSVWISPVNQNYEGPRTAYGDPYHGYWIADASQLNSRFGTSDDLKALSAELHRRGMFVTSVCHVCLRSPYFTRYLMVDIVANNVMATSITPDFSTYMFKEQVTPIVLCRMVVPNDLLFPSRSIIRTAPLTGIT